jgi:two-component system sensor histidine kinase BaeS
MRRRLTLATVGVVALALVLSGVGTLLLVRRAARIEVRRDLVRQADELAVAAEDPVTFRSLAAASRALKLEGLSRVTFSRNGAVLDGDLPEGISIDDLRSGALRSGARVSGLHGSLVYAAVGVRPPVGAGARSGRFIAVVLTRRADTGLDRGAGWLLLSSLVALAVAAAVADRVGRRLVAPVLAAEATTRRIAGGDLDARVDLPDGADAELASLAASINEMASTLGRARGLERQFLLAVSHDLRTPLTSIRGFAEAIADGAATDHARAASVIGAEARRLERLVADLLELAKLDARRFSLDVRAVDVAEVAVVTAEGFRPELEQHGLDLLTDVPPDLPDAIADPDRLSQVVANLVENGLKYASTKVAVSASAGDGAVVLAVEDDGPGIAAEDLGRVFERFATSDRAGARRGGTGLGLAIVAELVHAMGGTVRAGSDGRSGTRMEVRLRRADQAAPSGHN